MSISTTSEHPQLFQIDAGEGVHSLAFTANGEHLVSGCDKGVQVWRAADGYKLATMKVDSGGVASVAVSRDGRWIAAASWSDMFVWDARTYERVLVHKSKSDIIASVDFSPNSSRLVFADRRHCTAIILDIEARRKVRALVHASDQWDLVAKYSPRGDRIATATQGSVRVWDSNDGRQLLDIKVPVEQSHDLLWSKEYLFVQTKDGVITQINTVTGSIAAKWSVSHLNDTSCTALPEHGKFIAYSAEKTVIFWDTATHSQLGLIPHPHDVRSIACSSGGLLATASERRIIVKDLSSVVFPSSEREFHIHGDILDAWKHGQLSKAEALLTAASETSKSTAHYILACRALVRARLGQCKTAFADAEKSVEIQESVIGLIAICVTLAGKGETHAACRMCDVAVRQFHSEHVSLLLLIKAVILFMAGEHVDAMSRMHDLTTDTWVDPALYAVQAYMHLLFGNKCMESKNYEHAIKSFKNARDKLSNRSHQASLILSLIYGWRFDDLAVTIQQRLCEALLAAGCTKEAAESISHMIDKKIDMTLDFKRRCCHKLEELGDSAVSAKQYDVAIPLYTLALSLDPASPQVLVKRSKIYVENEMLEDALKDLNEAIVIDPSSPVGYETKHAVLLAMGRFGEAIIMFETMLLKMSESSDPGIHERSRHYVRPEQTKKAIRKSINKAIRDSPLVLINVLSGRLCNKSEQAAAFESTPDYTKLIASMTTRIDHTLIERVVRTFYRYATFSHTWEGDEPLYENVVDIEVYDLEALPTHVKLQMFCKIVRGERFVWAWSDTCCINKGDHFALQEALVSMFRWYEGSSMTIIFLCDVDRLAKLGALTDSIWNLRGWTLQEYHASKVVRIYTKDWTPYLGLTIYNHKDSPEIISEMEKATGIAAQALIALRPGLSDIWQKLHLASTRQTTRVEDAAYSLLGIFSMSLPVTYGDGDKALGRLLSQLLTSSGDTSVIAWRGRSGGFNSCLPTDLAVFQNPLTWHIPLPIADAEMETTTARLRASSLDLNLATRLFDKLNEFRTATFAGQRMRLPSLTFEIRVTSPFWDGKEWVFRAQAAVLGAFEIKTRQNLSKLDSLHLIHPWIDFLLDRRPVGNGIETIADECEHPVRGERPSSQNLSSTSHTGPQDAAFLRVPSPVLPMDKLTCVCQFLARLTRPFGALLLTPNRRNVEEYRRIATESLITVQIQELTSATLERLFQGARMLDVL